MVYPRLSPIQHACGIVFSFPVLVSVSTMQLGGLQVLGLYAVTATTTGCLFFLDTDTSAQSSGLIAIGILLMLLNVAYIALMAVLIIKQGARHGHGWAAWIKSNSQKTLAAVPRLLSCQVCWPVRSAHNHDQRDQAKQALAATMQLSDLRFARALSRRLSSWPLEAADFSQSRVASTHLSGSC